MASTRPGALSRFGAPEQVVPRVYPVLSGLFSGASRLNRFFPPAVSSRVLLLFLVLCATKLALVLRLGKHLFEIHWRIDGTQVEWIDYASFGFFVLIGSLTLARLAHYCQDIGASAVRTANIVILSSAVPFLFLTFHQGGNNYLYPILSGVLRWSSLGPYLADDLFFNLPFLFVWMAAYTFAYYVLVRTRRERYALYLTAAFAAAFAPSFLAHLAGFRNELLILNCIGVLSLLSSLGSTARTHIIWFILPAFWLLVGAGLLLCSVPDHLGLPLAYFSGLVALTVVLFAVVTLFAFKGSFSGLWMRFLFFYAATFLLLTNTRYPVAPNFSRALCLGLEFPRYFLGEALVCVLLGAMLAGVVRLKPRWKIWWFDVLALLLIGITFIDFRVSQIMGVRLGWDVLSLGNSPKMMWRMAKPYLPALGGAIVGVAGIYVAALLIAARRLKSKDLREDNASNSARESASAASPLLLSSGRAYAALIFFALGLLGLATANPDKGLDQAAVRLATTSPIWSRATSRTLSAEAFQQTAAELGMPGLGTTSPLPATPRRDLNVVLVFMESTYNKHLSLFSGTEETQPLLSRYRDRMELFPNFFSDFASSIHARFATFCSLYPVRDFNAFTLRRVGVKSIFEALHENGYSNSLFYSSYLDFTGFREFLANRAIDEIYDADSMPGERRSEPVSWGLREEETLAAMRARIKRYASEQQRFFLTYVPAAPHYPYEKVPEAFHKFKPVEFDDYTPLYLNDLLYMDWVIASLVDELKESNLLDKTLVIITDDHGEMLGGKGKPMGHGWLLSPELVNAPLIIMDPDKPGCSINNVIGSQVDLLPTLLERLGISPSPQQLYQGYSLDRPAPKRMIYLNSYQQYAVVQGDQMFFGDREKEGRGAASPMGGSFLIKNDGAKTFFESVASRNKISSSIQRFDTFQEDLLRNYAHYAKSVRTAKR